MSGMITSELQWRYTSPIALQITISSTVYSIVDYLYPEPVMRKARPYYDITIVLVATLDD